MKPSIHAEITRAALRGRGLSERCIDVVVSGNLAQDTLVDGDLFTPRYHFDECAFEESQAYIAEQWTEVSRACRRPGCDGVEDALGAFGRITHAIQDFYAHSNWVENRDDIWDGSQPDWLVSGTFIIPECRKPDADCPSHKELNKDRPGRPFHPKAVRLARQHTARLFDELLRRCPGLLECCRR